MRILILGSNGRLGYDISNFLEKYLSSEFVIIRSNRIDFDLSNFHSLENYIQKISPEFIINCSAYTNITSTESNDKNAFIINSFLVKLISKISLKFNIPIIHFSTEHVFDGMKKMPYVENDLVNPKNKYGFTKYWGEYFLRTKNEKHYIFRISWLLAFSGENFVTKIINNQLKKNRFNVVSDQVGVPVTSTFISKYILKILIDFKKNKLPYGTYHLTPSGEISRYELANEIIDIASNLKLIKKNNIIYPDKITSTNYHSNLYYPCNCVLSSNKLRNSIDLNINNWFDDLESFMRKKYS